MTIHLSILLFFPLVLGVARRAGAAQRSRRYGLLVGALVSLVYAVLLLFDFDTGSGRLQYVTDDKWIPELGIRYTLGVDGLNLWLIGLTTLLFAAVGAVDPRAAAGRAGREALRVPPRARRDRGARARSWRRT